MKNTFTLKARKITAIAFLFAFGITVSGCSQKGNSESQDGESEKGAQATPEADLESQWIPLFNGQDMKDWDIKIRGHELNENYGNTFRVEDGLLKVDYDQYENFDAQYGHIFYNQKFSSYLLSIEYRFTGEQAPGGEGWAWRNSGVMIHAQSAASMDKDQDFPTSIEVQFLGGNGKDERSTGNLCTPGTNVVMDGKLITDHCINSTSKTYHGDQWVRAEVLVLGDSVIKHIVEGDTVLTYQKPQLGGGEALEAAPSKRQDVQYLTEGYIALQSESHPIAFRKVVLFDLAKYRDNPAKLKEVLHQLQNRPIKD